MCKDICMRRIMNFIFSFSIIAAIACAGWFLFMVFQEARTLKRVISRLQADSRIAEVLVTGVNYDENRRENLTTIKFLEYNVDGRPLAPKYFTFPGNVIQFQSLVVRFEDIYVRQADKLRGKSAYFFWKAFMLDGANTREYEITKVNQVPEGYKLAQAQGRAQEKFWALFWRYALSPKDAKKLGIKNCQIEAPGAMFIPGVLYKIKIEHDGGMRIDAQPIAEIFKGEKIRRD